MLNRIILGSIILTLVACSVPEDKLWQKRVANAGVLPNDSAVVAALDLDVGLWVDSLNQDSLQKVALRDLPIYTFGRATPVDTARFVRDSVIPKLVVDYTQTRLQKTFAQVPLLQKLNLQPTVQWRSQQTSHLNALQQQGRALLDIAPALDSALAQAVHVSDTNFARVPVGAILVKNHRSYWWVVLVQSGDKPNTVAIDSTDHPDMRFKHLEGTSFDVKLLKTVGNFFSE